MNLKFLHVLRDGRDIALSKNQGPVHKFYSFMYNKKDVNEKDTRSLEAKAIRLWSDWNVQAYDYCAKHKADYQLVHSEATVTDNLHIRFETYRQIAQWVGSSLSNKEICCLAQQEAKFMGSHDHTVSQRKSAGDTVRQRYGKWRTALKSKPLMLESLNREGAKGLERFSYDVGWDNKAVLPKSSEYVCETMPETICPHPAPPSKAQAKAAPKPRSRSKVNRPDVIKGTCEMKIDTDYAKGSQDVGWVNVKTANDCCIACGEDKECMHFTFNDRNGICYFKKKTGTVQPSTGFTSGDLTLVKGGKGGAAPKTSKGGKEAAAPKKVPVVAPHKSDQTALVGECTLHNKTDYRGKTSKDIKYITVKTVQECCRVCGEGAKCLHFSFDTVSDVCYLKEATGKVVTQVEGLISGDCQFSKPGASSVTSTKIEAASLKGATKIDAGSLKGVKIASSTAATLAAMSPDEQTELGGLLKSISPVQL